MLHALLCVVQEDPKQAITARLAGRNHDPPDHALGTIVRSLQRNVEKLVGHVGKIRSLSVYDTLVLERAHDLIGQVLRQVKSAPKKRQGRQKGKRRKDS
jgi:hypothetical protein